MFSKIYFLNINRDTLTRFGLSTLSKEVVLFQLKFLNIFNLLKIFKSFFINLQQLPIKINFLNLKNARLKILLY